MNVSTITTPHHRNLSRRKLHGHAEDRADAVDRAVLRVGRVWGFYSDWSSSVSTNSVKVLTGDIKDHSIEIPNDCQLDPPRLGKVGKCEFHLSRIVKLDKVDPDNTENEDGLESKTSSQDHHDANEDQLAQAVSTKDRVIKLLSSLRVVAWVIAGLLVAILIRAR